MTDLASLALEQVDFLDLPLRSVPAPGSWVKLGRCRNAPIELFFPERGDDTSQAKDLCQRCPVIDECREYAVPHPSLQGVWGGTRARERAAIRAERAAETPVAEKPPRVVVPRGALDAALRTLAETPGRWAVVAHWPNETTATTTASLLRTGRRRHPPGSWRFEGRRNPAGGSDLYALCEAPAEAAAS